MIKSTFALLCLAGLALATPEEQLELCGEQMQFCVLGFIMREGIDMSQLEGGASGISVRELKMIYNVAVYHYTATNIKMC